MKMKKLYIAESTHDAHITQDLLKQRGHETEMRDANLASTFGQIPLKAVKTTLWVTEELYADAKKALTEIKSTPEKEYKPWNCHRCGESIEGNLLECWNCSAEKFAHSHK